MHSSNKLLHTGLSRPLRDRKPCLLSIIIWSSAVLREN